MRGFSLRLYSVLFTRAIAFCASESYGVATMATMTYSSSLRLCVCPCMRVARCVCVCECERERVCVRARVSVVSECGTRSKEDVCAYEKDA